MFISSDTLGQRTAGTSNVNTVDIGIINTTFHRLNINEDDLALSGVTVSNNQYAIVSGKPTFISKKIVVASPLKDVVSCSSINFNFNDYFVFNNATTSIKNLNVRFEENATNNAVSIISNGNYVVPTKNIVYSTTGLKTLTFEVTFTDNTVITTYATIFVNVDSGSTLRTTGTLCTENLRDKGVFPATANEISGTEAFTGYNAGDLSFRGQMEYSVFYSNNNYAKKMLNPIIIVDGFDPGDKRKVKDCDCENDPTCFSENKTVTLNGLGQNPMFSVAFNPISHESIEESMNYDGVNAIGLPEKINLMQELRTLGYDVIVINLPNYEILHPTQPTKQVFKPFPFPGSFVTVPNMVAVNGGADYIERNTLTLVSFIKNYVKPLQATAGSTNGMVLIGPSMGGQITRYALAYMEKKFAQTNDVTWKHNARLWVSVDSPHLGGNIPVGAQANIWFMADQLGNKSAEDRYADLNSVAGQQLSISNFEFARTSPAKNLIGSPYFNTYFNNLNTNGVAGSNGYPVSNASFRKIAMVNGSMNGTKQGQEGQSFLHTKIYIRGLWPFQSSTITLARFKDSFISGYDATGEVFKGNGQNFNIGLDHWIINHKRYTLTVNNQDIRGSHDIVPGGFLKLGQKLKTSIENGASDSGYRSHTYMEDFVPSNSFISTFSALGHLNPWQNWSNPLNTNLLCPTNRQTPFDGYFGANTNTEHTTFTKESADWLKKELAGNKQTPNFPIQENALSGDKFICENQTKTYVIADQCKVPSPVIYASNNGTLTNGWSVEGNLVIVSSTPYSVSVQGSGNGAGKVVETFQNGQKIATDVWVGAPSFTFEYTYYDIQPVKSTLCVVSAEPNMTLEQQGVTSITFKNSTGTTILPKLGFNCTRTTRPMCIEATVTNACGVTKYKYECEFFRQSSPTNYYTVFPNPAKNIVNIELRNKDNQPIEKAKITASLFNMMGVLQSNITIKNNMATIDVSDMIRGLYLLKIDIDGIVETHHISLE